jgi:hypothetical protein
MRPRLAYPVICPFCGDPLGGEVRTVEGIATHHWDCWEARPVCEVCGDGRLKGWRCKECVLAAPN